MNDREMELEDLITSRSGDVLRLQAKADAAMPEMAKVWRDEARRAASDVARLVALREPANAVRGDHREPGVHGEGGELGAGVPIGGAVDRAVELGRAQPEVSALPGDDEVTPRFVFVTEVSGQKPAGYDHLGHALRTVRHSGEAA